MISLAQSPQEAVILGMLTTGILALIASALLRWSGVGPGWTGLLLPIFFLIAYWLVYNKVPVFPPVGAVNKIFYIAAIGSLLGVFIEIAAAPWLAQTSMIVLPIVSAVYIGAARLLVAPLEVAAAALFGLLALYLFASKMGRAEAERSIRQATLLGVASVGLAPIALLGASSSSFQLSLFYAAAIAAIVLVNLTNANFNFSRASLFGGAGGLIAVVQTVTLITRKTDLLALAVLSLVFLAPLAANPILDRTKITNKFVRTMVFAGICLVVASISFVTVLVRYGSSFPV